MRKAYLFPFILAGAVAAAGTVQANPFHKGQGDGFRGGPMNGPTEVDRVLQLAHRLERVAEQIGLSEEQRDAIHAVVDEARPQLRDLGGEMRANRDELREASSPENYDPGAVSALATAQGELIARGIVLGAQVRFDVLAVLTPDQREQLEALRGERRRRHH